MKELNKTIHKNGFEYHQVKKGKAAYIYEQIVNPGVTYYEVFLKRTRPEEMIMGNLYPEREVFPKDEDFGYTAWCVRSYERACERFNKLENKPTNN
jgi:hypothetical protein